MGKKWSPSFPPMEFEIAPVDIFPLSAPAARDNYHEEMVKPPDDGGAQPPCSKFPRIQTVSVIYPFAVSSERAPRTLDVFALPHCSTILVLIRGKCSASQVEFTLRTVRGPRRERINGFADIFQPLHYFRLASRTDAVRNQSGMNGKIL